MATILRSMMKPFHPQFPGILRRHQIVVDLRTMKNCYFLNNMSLGIRLIQTFLYSCHSNNFYLILYKNLTYASLKPIALAIVP